MKLLNGIYLVGSGEIGLTHPLDCHIYLIDGGEKKALVDSGLGLKPELIEKQIELHNIDLNDIDYLLLTHCHADHAGGAQYFSSNYNIKVIAPAKESTYLKEGDEKSIGLDIARNAGYYPSDYRFNACPVYREVENGDSIEIGNIMLSAIETPGHSIGSISYYGTIDGKRVIFIGDLLAAGGRISLQNIPGVNIEEYSKSVMNLKGLGVDAFLPGHSLFTINRGQKHIDLAINAFSKLGIPKNII